MRRRAWDAYGAAKAPVVLAWGALEERVRGRATTPAAPVDGDVRERLRAHLVDDLLPFWRRTADPVHGGFFNVVDADGRPDPDAPKRVALQARIVYALASAHEVSGDPVDLELARAGVRFLRERCWDDVHGGWYASVGRDGAVLDDTKEGFTHAYAATGLLEAARAGADPDARAPGEQTLELFDERAGDPRHGGVFDSRTRDWRPHSDRKSACVHLDLLAAEEQRAALAGEPAALARVRERADVMLAGLTDPDTGWIVEFAGADWSYLPLATRDQVLVGHQLKLALHLLRLHRATGDDRYAAVGRGLVERCVRHGWDERHGGFFQRLSRRGHRASNVKLWWPQAQGILALAALHELDGDPATLRRLRRLTGFVLGAFRDPEHGEWHRTCWRDGRPKDTRKATDSKAAFHTVQACAQLQGSVLAR